MVKPKERDINNKLYIFKRFYTIDNWCSTELELYLTLQVKTLTLEGLCDKHQSALTFCYLFNLLINTTLN